MLLNTSNGKCDQSLNTNKLDETSIIVRNKLYIVYLIDVSLHLMPTNLQLDLAITATIGEAKACLLYHCFI